MVIQLNSVCRRWYPKKLYSSSGCWLHVHYFMIWYYIIKDLQFEVASCHCVIKQMLSMSIQQFDGCQVCTISMGIAFIGISIRGMPGMLQTRFNSSPPGAAYMRQWIGSALVQIMACRLFGAKPLSNPMLGYFNWTLTNNLQWNFNQDIKVCIHENAS